MAAAIPTDPASMSRVTSVTVNARCKVVVSRAWMGVQDTEDKPSAYSGCWWSSFSMLCVHGFYFLGSWMTRKYMKLYLG